MTVASFLESVSSLWISFFGSDFASLIFIPFFCVAVLIVLVKVVYYLVRFNS